MIYSASYFAPKHHHGQLYSISRSTPINFRHLPVIDCFVPNTPEIKRLNKSAPRFVERYTELYRQLWRDRFLVIQKWMNELDPDVDLTILCWEKSTDFCHRDLVMKAISHYRPDCYGGQDTTKPMLIDLEPRLQLPLFQ